MRNRSQWHYQRQEKGDGATPIGEFYLREIYFRPDRLKSQSNLPITAIGPDDGWSDDPADPDYNRRVAIPLRSDMKRFGAAIRCTISLCPSDQRRTTVSGLSAIFLHVASDQYAATEGCVALARNDLLEILKDCDHTSVVIVKPSASAVQR